MSICIFDSDLQQDIAINGYAEVTLPIANQSGGSCVTNRYGDICLNGYISQYYCNATAPEGVSRREIFCPYGCINQTTCAVQPSGNNTTPNPYCFDSDGGINPLKKGATIFFGNITHDGCREDGLLAEQFCSWGNPYTEPIDCSMYGSRYVCVDGRCVQHAQFSRSNIIFVTSQVFNGSLGGLDGADALCQQAATNAGLPGVFKAWLSTSDAPASGRLVHSTYPYTRVDGVIVASNWNDFTDGLHYNVISVNEFGVNIASISSYLNVWTASSIAGASLSPNCNGWTVGDLSAIGRDGVAIRVDAPWTDVYYQGSFCGNGRRIYCIQQNMYRMVERIQLRNG